MDRIGRYEIIRELGRGAMGVVYHARDPKIGRDIAIKTIKLADQADSSEVDALRERLFREAQSAGKLSHPNIVTIYDVDEEDGVAYIAMELVEGETLDVTLKGGPITDLERVGNILKQTGAALDYAHTKGIVHRDVKPGNLILTVAGALKVMDFGIARISSSSLTQTGTVMGTPSYMSPEQVKGVDLDGRSDEFSLGVIAYEMLTGKKPFVAETVTSVIFKIVTSEPQKLADACPWISPGVDAVVLKALSKEAEKRYKTCLGFAEGFSAAAAGLDAPLEPEADGADPKPEAEQTAAIESGAYDATAAYSGSAAGRAESEASGEASTPTERQLPPLSSAGARDATAASEAAEASEPTGSGIGRKILIAALALVVVGTGALALASPTFLSDPLGSIQALLQGKQALDTQTQAEVEREFARLNATLPDPVDPVLIEPANPIDSSSEAPEPAAAIVEQPEPKPVAPAPAAFAPTPPAPKAAPKKTPAAPAKTVSVYFRTTPVGAEIQVDSNSEWACTSPCRLDELPTGQRTFTARLAGFYPATRRIVLGDKSNEVVEIKLEDARISVIITSEPPGADIFIDGQKIPQQTNAKVPLQPGTYQIKVSKQGAGSAEQVVLVDRDRLPFAKFTLAP